MIWNVKNSAKRKSLLERLVNFEDVEGEGLSNEAVEWHDEPAKWRNVVVTAAQNADMDEAMRDGAKTDTEEDDTEDNFGAGGGGAYTDALYDESISLPNISGLSDSSDSSSHYDSEETAPSEEFEGGNKVYISTKPASEMNAKPKYFDILERAKGGPNADREAMSIHYEIPKKVYSVPVRSEYETAPRSVSFLERIEDEPDSPTVHSIVESVHESEVGGVVEEAVEALTGLPETEAVESGQDTHDTIENPDIVVAEPPVTIEDPVTHERFRTQRSIAFEKVLFPEEYFYMKNGSVLKNADHLCSELENMDDETFAHHAYSRGTNDFASWIRHVYGCEECADRLAQAESKEDHVGILREYL